MAFFLDDCSQSYCLMPTNLWKKRDSFLDSAEYTTAKDFKIFTDWKVELCAAGVFYGTYLLEARRDAAIKKLANHIEDKKKPVKNEDSETDENVDEDEVSEF